MQGATASILIILALTACQGAATRANGEPSSSTRSNPLADSSFPAAAERAFRGVVEERIGAGGYSYLAVAREDGRATWVATMGPGATVGDHVSVEGFAAHDDFHSSRLDRDFGRVVFGIVTPEQTHL